MPFLHLDTWLVSFRQFRSDHVAELENLEWEQRWTRFAELNIIHDIEVLRQHSDGIQAMKDRGLTIHDVIYGVETGLLRELEIPNENAERWTWAFAV